MRCSSVGGFALAVAASVVLGPIAAGCGLATPSAATEDGSGEDGSGDDSSGDDGSGLRIPPRPEHAGCETLDCGPQGTCVVRHQEAVCLCPEGQLANNRTSENTARGCIPCEPLATGEPLTHDFQTRSLSGLVRVDGLSLEDDTTNTGELELVGVMEGDRISVGSVQDGEYAGQLFPGRYHLDFRGFSSSGLAPENQLVRLRENIELNQDTSLDVDIATGIVSGLLTVDGKLELDDVETARLSLVDPSTDGVLWLGEVREGSYYRRAVRGTYDLMYDANVPAGDSTAPVNRGATLMHGIEVGAVTELDIDIPAVTVHGSLSLSRIPAPDPFSPLPEGPDPSSRVVLRSTDELGTVYLGSTEEGRYEVALIPGEYEVLVEAERFGEGAPQNPIARLWSAGLVTFESDQQFDVDISTVRISGAITIGGITVPDPFDYGLLYLRDVHDGASVELGATFAGAYDIEILPGRYDLVYRGVMPDALAPVGQDVVVLEDLEFTVDRQFDIDIPTVRVYGLFEILGGQVDPPDAFDPSAVFLLDPETGAEMSLAPLREGQYEVNVVPGRYDLMFRSGNNNSNNDIANNQHYLLRGDLRIREDRQLDVRMRPRILDYAFLIDGTPVEALAGYNAYLRNDGIVDQVALGFTLDTERSLPMLPGSYFLDLEVSNARTPTLNRSGRVGCWWISP